MQDDLKPIDEAFWKSVMRSSAVSAPSGPPRQHPAVGGLRILWIGLQMQDLVTSSTV